MTVLKEGGGHGAREDVRRRIAATNIFPDRRVAAHPSAFHPLVPHSGELVQRMNHPTHIAVNGGEVIDVNQPACRNHLDSLQRGGATSSTVRLPAIQAPGSSSTWMAGGCMG